MKISVNTQSLRTTKLIARALLSASLVASILSACVTINIYFPAAAAEKAADKIIDDVWQLNPNGKPASSKTDSGGEAKPTIPTETKPAEVK